MPYSAKFKDKVMAYAETHGVSAASVKYSVSGNSVRAWLTAAGRKPARVSSQKRRSYTAEMKRDALAYYKNHTLAETAKYFNVPPHTVSQWARSAGLNKQGSEIPTSHLLKEEVSDPRVYLEKVRDQQKDRITFLRAKLREAEDIYAKTELALKLFGEDQHEDQTVA